MERLLDEKQAAEILGITPVALRKQRCMGVRPGEMPVVPWLKLGSRVRYKASALQSYIDALEEHGEGAAV